MLNTDPDDLHVDETDDAAVARIAAAGGRGALALASLATAIVIGLWLAFYCLVFLPRGPAP